METPTSSDTTRPPHNARAKIFGATVLSLGTTIFMIDYINLRSSVTRHLRAEEPAHVVAAAIRKPIMTTFFEPVEGGCCGMTQQGHQNLVDSWTRAWQGFGWETRILTEADAKKHPQFDTLQNKLIEAKVSEYDRRCFWRWLSMANEDDALGGWMSDYDLFPLTLTSYKGTQLMSQPGFKTYGGHVPALIHADQASWKKMVQMMIDVLAPDMDIEFISDMFLLDYLHKHFTEEEIGVTTWEYSLWKKFPYKRVPGQEDPVIDCEVVKSHLAAHLSHRGAKEAFEVEHTYPKIEEEIKPGEYPEFRAQAADVMMADMDQCIDADASVS